MAKYADIVYDELTDNKTGGTGGFAYFASRSEIATCPSLPAAPATDAEYVELSADITMETGKTFGKVPLVADTSKFRSELVGPKGTKLFKHQLNARLLGDGVAQRKFMRLAKNDDLIVLIPTSDCDGKYLMLGNCCKSATIDVLTSDTGLTSEDEEAGNAIEMSSFAYGQIPKPTYTGTVPVAA